MFDDSTKTIRATFKTREAADLAIEHLVQSHGISRADIFVQPVALNNSAGSAPSGGDVRRDGDVRTDAPLDGEIEVSTDIAASKIAAVQRTFGDLDAIWVSGRAAPLVPVAVCKIVRGKLAKPVAHAEVVLNDVENDTHSELMGSVDETPKIVRFSVERRRRVGEDAIVPPAELPAEFIDRHDFKAGDPGLFQERQLFSRGSIGPLGSECANMHLIEDLMGWSDALPILIMPEEIVRIDDHRRTWWARRRISSRIGTVSELELVECSGTNAADNKAKIPISIPVHLPFTAIREEGDRFLCRCPDTKRDTITYNFRTVGIPSSGLRWFRVEGGAVLMVHPAA